MFGIRPDPKHYVIRVHMDISKKYTGFFHDGLLIDIEHKNDKIIFLMQSAEITQKVMSEDMQLSDDHKILPENLALSKENCIVGKLHIENIKKITVDDQVYHGLLVKKYDDGEILDFQIDGCSVELSINWVDYPPKPEIDEFTTIRIEAEKISWENIPDWVESWGSN